MSSPVTTVQILQTTDRQAAIDALRLAVAAAHRSESVLRLTLHESMNRAGEFVLIGATSGLTTADDAFVPPDAGLHEVARTVLDPLPGGTAAKGLIASPPPPGRAETQRVFIAVLPLRAGGFAKAFDLLDEEMAPTHAEEGVHRFALHRDPAIPDAITVVEAWRDTADWLAHQDTAYYQKVMAHLPGLMAGDMTVHTVLPIMAGDPAKATL